MLRALVTCALVLGLAPSSARAAAAHPGMLSGEGFTFKFSLGPIEGGRARMAVGQPVTKDGKRVIAIRGQAETTALVKLLARETDDYQLTVDPANLMSLYVEEHETGLHNRDLKQSIAGRAVDVDFKSAQRAVKGRRVLPKLARDPLAGFFALRALPLHDGQKLAFDIIDGLWLYRVAATVAGAQTVTLTAPGSKSQRAIRIDCVAQRINDDGSPQPMPQRKLTMWLGDDTVRPLLKLQAETELGPVILELTSYVPGKTARHESAPQLPGIEVR